jgi:uncharacterized protein (TIGR02271 family)
MSRTVTAFFDSRQEAEAAKSRLQSSRIDAERIRIVDKSSAGSSSDSGEGKGFFASLTDMFMPHEDRHAYQEGINRGGYLLCAQVDEDEADEAIQILDQSNSVDFDERERGWRNEGWQGWTGAQGMSGSGMSSSGMTGGMQQGSGQQPGMQMGGMQQTGMQQGGMQETGRTIEEERIPLVEEELQVGKREVNRGGARVRSYVREVPVHEQISLREEHVSVERRPVNERIDANQLNSGDMLRDRTIEMTETAEEAVVAKQARVKEEVVLRKTAEEHVEQISDTVRRTEVDVDESQGGNDRPAFGFGGERGSERSGQSSFESERNEDPAWRS